MTVQRTDAASQSSRPRAAYPGGMVAEVPAFNKANTDYVEQSNARYSAAQRANAMMEYDFYEDEAL